MFGKGQN